MDYYLRCTKCSRKYDSTYKRQTCESCESILDVVYKKKVRVPHGKGFWDYEKMLPEGRYTHYDLGGTELVKSTEHDNLFLKLELQNPTKSFKDRGSVVEVSKAKEYGYKELVVASTGNMAYSLAYYAKTIGIKATVFIGTGANPDKIRDILLTHDATLKRVNGDFTKAQEHAAAYASSRHAFLAGDYCYRKEGQKTVMYEIAAQLRGITHVIVPVGNATLISGIGRALKEMGNKRIRIVAVQAEGCCPLVRALKQRKGIRYERSRTAADAIAVGMPTFGDQAIEAIRRSKGTAISVTEDEMKKEQDTLYKKQGILAELAGVASIAAYERLRFKKSDKVVAIVSGGNV